MQEAEKIRKLKAYADAVLAAVQAEPPVTDPGIERLFQEIRSAAQETVRRAGPLCCAGARRSCPHSVILAHRRPGSWLEGQTRGG